MDHAWPLNNSENAAGRGEGIAQSHRVTCRGERSPSLPGVGTSPRPQCSSSTSVDQSVCDPSGLPVITRLQCLLRACPPTRVFSDSGEPLESLHHIPATLRCAAQYTAPPLTRPETPVSFWLTLPPQRVQSSPGLNPGSKAGPQPSSRLSAAAYLLPPGLPPGIPVSLQQGAAPTVPRMSPSAEPWVGGSI